MSWHVFMVLGTSLFILLESFMRMIYLFLNLAGSITKQSYILLYLVFKLQLLCQRFLLPNQLLYLSFQFFNLFLVADSLDSNWEIRALKSLVSPSIIINCTVNASFYVSKFWYSFSNLSFSEIMASCFFFNYIPSPHIFTKLSFNFRMFSLFCSTLFINLSMLSALAW